MSARKAAPLLFCALCSCFDPAEVKDVKVIGHGGMGAGRVWPMDTQASISEAIAGKADGVEFDVQLTADSVLVAYHDEQLSIGTNCTGRVNAQRWSDLRSCRFTAVPPAIREEFPLMALDSLFAHIPVDRRPILTFDCKLFAAGDWDAYLEAYTNALVDIIERYALAERVTIECKDVDFLKRLQRKDPRLAIFLYVSDFYEGLKTAQENSFAGITIITNRITRGQVDEAHAAGTRVALFGTSSAWDHRMALRKRPDLIQTDDVPGLLEMLER